MHDCTITTVKFMGDFSSQIHSISCDVKGIVYLVEFRDGTFRFKAEKQCLMTRRLGATFSLAPLVQSHNHANQAWLDVMQRLDGNMYKNEKEKQEQAKLLA